MKLLRNIPIRAYLILSFTGLAAITLFVSLLLSRGNDAKRDQDVFVKEVRDTAQLVAYNLRAALAFESYDEAGELLQSLSMRNTMDSVFVVDINGQTVAQYQRPTLIKKITPEDFPLTYDLTDSHLMVRQPIRHDGDLLGHLLLAEHLDRLTLAAELADSNALINFSICMLLGIGAAYLLGYQISRPIVRLSQIAQSVTDHRDWSIRAPKYNMQEVKELSESFNRMLERIQLSEEELQQHVVALIEEQENLRIAQQRERTLESRLSRAQRMESLGLLAGGVAHDLNNILGPVLAYPDLILTQLTPEDPIAEDLLEIKSAAKKSAAIIQDLLTLARRGNYQNEVLSLNDAMAAFLKSAAFKKRYSEFSQISLDTHYDETLPSIMGSSAHLTQVLMNICINALESMPEEARLTIRTESVEITEDRSILHGVVSPGHYAVLTVQDTGEGIPEEVLGDIFEPFFSRKKLGHSGTGLGLSVVYGITHDMGGCIDVESTVGQGTSFTLYFPATTRTVTPVDQKIMPEGRNERILIVDDIEAQRKLGMRLLAQLGYRVAQAESGQAALDYIQREHVDLVLLDMIMEPGWSGLETYIQLSKVRPGIRCIICSGYSDKSSRDEAQALGLKDQVMKPYTITELANVIREVLDRPEVPVSEQTEG